MLEGRRHFAPAAMLVTSDGIEQVDGSGAMCKQRLDYRMLERIWRKRFLESVEAEQGTPEQVKGRTEGINELLNCSSRAIEVENIASSLANFET